jgi:riboflavin kinase/FMN adenylyltransferase
MSAFRQSLDAPAPDVCRNGIVTLGNFDGVHRGHQALIAEAGRRGHPAVAVTFDPHPLQLLRPAAFQPLLTTIDYRAELLHAAGADHVVILETTPALLELTARAFFARVIQRDLAARALVEGYNFAFGKGRAGTIDVLRDLCAEAGLPLTLVPPVEVFGKPVSSSRVRAELLAGQLEVVHALLDRPYSVAGMVVAGQRRGQTLGFPTANLDSIVTLIPGNGVYAVRTHHDGKWWPAAANVGPNPTFGEAARKIEVHLIGFTGDLYGEKLTIDFIEKIRDTRRFGSVAELVAQVGSDVERVKHLAAYSARMRADRA